LPFNSPSATSQRTWYAFTVSIGNSHEPIRTRNDLIPEIAGPGAVVVDEELCAQGFDYIDEIASYFWVYIPSIMVYEDNWLWSEATDLFDKYHELLTKQANQYVNSVLEEY
jgi:hypothetical protein